MRVYERDAHPSNKDVSALNVVVRMHGKRRLSAINAAWVDDRITEMKRVERLAPATIRARVGALVRCTDWGMRKEYLQLPDHPLRTLPKGYAQYTKTDTALAGVERVDIERDRRLEKGEYEKVMAIIDAGTIAQKQRDFKIPYTAAVRCMFVLAPETAMRMREMYTLRSGQVDLKRKTVFLDKTKNGDKRQVPLTSVALKALDGYMQAAEDEINRRDGLIFPWWDGNTSHRVLVQTSDYVSKLYKKIFEAAGCVDLTFHDLRHEATSRLFERTTLSEARIMKITGHRSHRVLMRYANLRASDLAESLW